MGKFVKRLTALLLLVALIAVFPATTYATTGCLHEEGEVLGTPDDISGYILPDDESTSGSISGGTAGTDMVVIPDIGGGKWATIFSIRAGEVRDLLVSREGKKSFRRCDLPYDAKEFLITGKLYHSTEKSPNTSIGPIRCGICYYDLWKQVYVRVYSVYSHNSEQIHETVSVDSVMEKVPDCCGFDRKTEELYTFVKNFAGYGHVYGDVSLYYSCE